MENSPFNSKFRVITPLEVTKLKRIETEDKKIYDIHPSLKALESKLCVISDTSFQIVDVPSLKVDLHDYQKYGISWMVNQEKTSIKGGILADEMGMGKTLQMIGLILSGSVDEVTLVVVPTVALHQWTSEINRFTDEINVIVNYGRNKINELILDKNRFNLILTTYGTVESEYRMMVKSINEMNKKNCIESEEADYDDAKKKFTTKDQKSKRSKKEDKKHILFSTKFHRVVLDEAHSIKDPRSGTNTAISNLNANVRWGMTGTPVQNRVSDLFALVKFLRLDPHAYYFCKKCECKSFTWLQYDRSEGSYKNRGFCKCGHFGALHFGWWNRRITNLIKDYGYTTRGAEIFDNLKKITSHIVLRRTKDELDFLPNKTVKVIYKKFSKQEKDFYESLYSNTSRKFQDYAQKGEISNNYAHIFELLQKMRLSANHPFLVQKREGPPMCGYCNEEADDPIISKCKHIFCREEARVFLGDTGKCPVCKVKITIDLMQKIEFTYKTQFYDNWRSSTKIEALVEKLTMQRNENIHIKSIIFSQYVNFLEMLRWRLNRAGFNTVCIYGCMPVNSRKVAVDSFNSDSSINIFLISLKAGGVALNLTEASQVFIMDLWWNPAVEEQAMDRIHRIGQNRPISIYKIVISDSIESKVLQLQKKKKALFESAVANDLAALEKLDEDDLVFLFS